MAYQVPSANHPWRQYANKEYVKPEERKYGKTVRVFIQEISESWDNIEVITTAYGKEGRFTLNELPQERQAMWLSALLRKNYGNQN